jgi:hypothetical protein
LTLPLNWVSVASVRKVSFFTVHELTTHPKQVEDMYEYVSAGPLTLVADARRAHSDITKILIRIELIHFEHQFPDSIA